MTICLIVGYVASWHHYLVRDKVAASGAPPPAHGGVRLRVVHLQSSQRLEAELESA